MRSVRLDEIEHAAQDAIVFGAGHLIERFGDFGPHAFHAAFPPVSRVRIEQCEE